MFTHADSSFIGLCLEMFLFGFYTGIFVIYLQFPSKESKTATIIYYVLCLLYFLSAAALVCDFLRIVLQMCLARKIQVEKVSRSRLPYLGFVQTALNSCSELITLFVLIFRCWILWDRNTRVVIIPSFLAITSIPTWLAADGATKWDKELGQFYIYPWGFTVTLTALAASMAVNTLVTGLIVFKILKVSLEVKATSAERTLGLLGSNAGGSKTRHIAFIIIESGMALFAIQLVRVVLTSLCAVQKDNMPAVLTLNMVYGIQEMLNGIAPTIIYVRGRLSFDDEMSFKEAIGNLVFQVNIPPSDPNTLVPQRVELGSMPPRGKHEDICFNISPSDPKSLRRMGSCSNKSDPSLSTVDSQY